MREFLSRWAWRGPLYGAGDKVGALAEMERIASDVGARFGVTVAELKGGDRRRVIAWPRQEAMSAIYATRRFSLPTIGAFFGGRDHTTVIHAIRAVEARAGRPVPSRITPDRHLAALARAFAQQEAA